MTISTPLAVDSTKYSSPELLTPEFLKFKLFSTKRSGIFRRSRLKMWSAMLVCRLQRRYRIGLRNKFMGHITGIVRLSNRIQDCRIIEFLSLVQIVPSRVARGVIKSDEVVTRANGADDVTLHNLHMIDIIEKFYAR